MEALTVVCLLALLVIAGYVTRMRMKGYAWIPLDDSKKHEELTEVVVDKDSQREKKTRPFLPIQSFVPQMLRSDPSGAQSPIEKSIRSALKDLQSRQYVRNICSRFEARTVTRTTPAMDETGALNPMAVAPVAAPGNSFEKRRSSVSAVAQLAQRSGVAVAAVAPKANNLNSFLSRYSSNLERATFVETPAASFAAPEPVASPIAKSSMDLITYEPPAEESSAAANGSYDLHERSFAAGILISLMSSVVVDGDESDSNQCDSPVQLDELRISAAFEADESAAVAAAVDATMHPAEQQVTNNMDLSTATLRLPKQQAPEEEDEFTNGVVPERPTQSRLHKFQLQFPPTAI